MRDDLKNSYDSRYFGSVPLRLVRGKALFVCWPKEAARIGKELP